MTQSRQPYGRWILPRPTSSCPELDSEGGVFSNSLVDPGSTRKVDSVCVRAEEHHLGAAKGASDRRSGGGPAFSELGCDWTRTPWTETTTVPAPSLPHAASMGFADAHGRARVADVDTGPDWDQQAGRLETVDHDPLDP